MTTRFFLTSLLLISCVAVVAQKLHGKQDVSVYAPASIKIDGKATEWNSFQAYNQATELFYTMANDNDKLYFICKATEEEVIQKIINGGITLSVNSTDKKATSTPVAITFPIVPWLNAQINYDIRPPAPLKEAVVKLVNDKISGHLKEIKVTGLKEFPDGVVSVYNDNGITGAHYIGNDKVYTCELAFPLKYIRPLLDDKGTFNYRLQVNGMDMKTTIVVGGAGSNGSAPSDQAVPHGALYHMSPTYFNETYTLAQK